VREINWPEEHGKEEAAEKKRNDHTGFMLLYQRFIAMKSMVFWGMTPCSPLSFNRRFGGTYRLHIQGRRNRFSKPASNQSAACHLLTRWFAELFFDPEDGDDTFL
jgi:hypothetical protein